MIDNLDGVKLYPLDVGLPIPKLNLRNLKAKLYIKLQIQYEPASPKLGCTSGKLKGKARQMDKKVDHGQINKS